MPIRVVLRDGVFHPIDPVPDNWPEGAESEVADPNPDDRLEAFNQRCAEIEALASEVGLDDLGPLNALLDEADREEKMRMLEKMENP